MNLGRIEKAISRARSKVAEKKLKALGAWVDGKKAYYMIFGKFADLTEAQKAKIDGLEKICVSCGLELNVFHFIDKLGDEFKEGTE